MQVQFKNSHPQLGNRLLQIDLTPGGNYVGIKNSNSDSMIMLSDVQLEELRLFLNKWEESRV